MSSLRLLQYEVAVSNMDAAFKLDKILSNQISD